MAKRPFFLLLSALDKGELVTDQSLCSAWQAYNNNLPTRVVPPKVDSKKSTKAVWKLNFPFIYSFAHAGVVEEPLGSCTELSNQQAFDGITHDQNLLDFNLLIEDEMENAEKIVKAKAAQNGCPNLKVIPVPNLFTGNAFSAGIKSSIPVKVTLTNGRILEKPVDQFTNDEMELISPAIRKTVFKKVLSPRTAYAINPNPSNSLSIRNTLLFREQKTKSFQTI